MRRLPRTPRVRETSTERPTAAGPFNAFMDPTPHRLTRTLFRIAFAAAVSLAVLTAGPAGAGPAGPVLIGPDDGAEAGALPVFAWQAVAKADRYEFELSADPGFNSAIAMVSTKNTRATLKTAIANGTYHWRVRAVTAAGAVGTWSAARMLELAWTANPSLLSPGDGAVLDYPTDALRLSWTPVEGAGEYLVRIATDPALGSLIWTSGPVKTAATGYTLTAPIAPGTYYWAVTPLNAQGHAGAPSATKSFEWRWPSTTTPIFTDLGPQPEIVDPFFSWTRVLGAAGYEVEVNSSSDWAPGSKVCCAAVRFGSSISTLGLSLAPLLQLDNNTYYWRVRPIDPSGNAGSWSVGPSFTQTFANVPPTPAPSVKNLRLRDNASDPNDGADPATVPYPLETATPVLAWNPVAGASAYQVDVTPFLAGACDWSFSTTSHWVETVSAPAWTPLGWGWNNVKPFPSPVGVSNENHALNAGWSYCARVRPVDGPSQLSGPTVFGDWTYLPANNVAAFTWTGSPEAGACSCALAAGDYNTPQTGTTTTRMPLFTWEAIPGARSYFVLVARDPNFTNVVDYAFTKIPAYAPRTGNATKGYPDELTSYYWAVLPALNLDGSGVSANPLDGTAPSFHKQAVPPSLVDPAAGAVVDGPTTFRWTNAEAARRYRIQVSQDPSFANPIDDTVTDSTAYTSNTTYPANTTLYWRVRADAEDGSGQVGLTWSETGTFQKQLPAPVPDPGNPTAGALIPTWSWAPVPGAISYDVTVEEPDGDTRNFDDLPLHAFTPVKMTGVGIFAARVRANFPTATNQVVHGPYSPLMQFARTIPEPSGAAAEKGANHLLFSWNPRAGAKQYRVQVSTRADFALPVETLLTQAPNHAPLLTQRDYMDGGTFYWRVAAIDADGNVGDYTATQQIVTTRRMRLSTYGSPTARRTTSLVVMTRTSRGALGGVRVRIWGAGLRARTKRTTADGRVTFSVTPRKRGRIYVRATKAGFYTTQTSVVVRALRRR